MVWIHWGLAVEAEEAAQWHFFFFFLPQRSKNYLIKYEAFKIVQRENSMTESSNMLKLLGVKKQFVCPEEQAEQFLYLDTSTLKHWAEATSPNLPPLCSITNTTHPLTRLQLPL